MLKYTLFFSLFFVPPFFGMYYNCLNEAVLRYIGMWWQLIGVGLIYITIQRNLAEAGQPTYPRYLMNSIIFQISEGYRRTFRKKRPVFVQANMVSAVSAVLKARISVKGFNALQRLDNLESALRGISREHDELAQELKNNMDIMRKDYCIRFKNLEQDLVSIKSQINDIRTGNVHVDMVGLIAVAFGIILATASVEISKFLASFEIVCTGGHGELSKHVFDRPPA
jgi:hypothetical protein